MKKIALFLVLITNCIASFNVSGNTYSLHSTKLTISSQILGEERQLVVFLPSSYQDTQKKFPVLYLTDGDIQGPHTVGTIDYLAKFDIAPEMIVVGIVNPRQQRTNDLTLASEGEKHATSLLGADKFLEFIEQEVIPEINKRFRTLDYKALSGTSHGGQFAINAMIKKPGLFNGFIAVSPSLYWQNGKLIELAKQALIKKRLSGRLFISIANEQPVMTDTFQQFVSLTKEFPSKDLKVLSKTFKDESHDSTTLLGQYYGIKYLFADWPIPNSPQTLADLQAKFDARSELLGVQMRIPEDRANGYGQWLQYLNRKHDALDMFKWNREAYSQSFNAHLSLIRAYKHFDQVEEANEAVATALKELQQLNVEQKNQLQNLKI